MFYNLDTEEGESGAPAYLIFGDQVILIGIHKGYSGEMKLNTCIMITQQIVATLKSWIQEMKGSLFEISLNNKSLKN
jgi:V8-like Glu-specific endopeptidase